MASDDRVSRVILRYDTDQASAQTVLSSLKRIEANFSTLEGRVASTSETSKQLAAQIKQFERQTAIENLAKEFAQLGVQMNQTDEYALKLRASLRDVGASKDEIREAYFAFDEFTKKAQEAANATGSVSSGKGFSVEGLRRTGGAINQLLPDSPIGPAIQRVGDFGQIFKEIGELGNSISKLGDESSLATSLVSNLGGETAVLGVSAGLAAVAIGIVAVGVKHFQDVIEPSSAALKKASDALSAYYDAIENGTTVTIKAQIAHAQQQLEDKKAELATRQNAAGGAFEGLKQGNVAADILGSFSPTGNVGGALNDLGARIVQGVADTTPAMKAFNDETEKLKTQIDSLNSQIEGWTRSLDDVAVKGRDAVAAIDKQFGNQLENDLLAKSGSSDAVKGTIEENKLRLDSLKEEIGVLNESADSNDAAAARLKELSDQYDDLKAKTDELVKTTLPLIEQREKEAAGVEILKKRDEAIQQLEDKAAQDRIALQQKTADKISDLIQKEIDANTAALSKLEQRQDELLTGASRDQSKDDRKAALEDVQLDIKARRQDRDDLTAHLRKVKQIQDNSRSQERDALLSRNFLALFELSENKREQTAQEDKAYAERKEDRAKELTDEKQDRALARRAEQNERRIALQNALNDAKQAYNKELQANHDAKEKGIRLANDAYTKELAALNAKLTYEENLKQQAAIRDIQRLFETDQAKLEEEARYIAEFKRILSGASSGYTPPDLSQNGTATGGSIPLRFMADGGSVIKNQPFVFNEPGSTQRETVNIGGTRFTSNGPALVFPLRGGSVDSGRSGGSRSISLSMPISVSVDGGNANLPRQIAAEIKRQIPDAVLRELDSL